jgi:hypothetical protein
VEEVETRNTQRWANEIVSHSYHVASGLGALALMGTVASTVPASAKCMIDEGNGRYLYKSKKCMIDEGNGRYTPCEALAKPKKQKKR